MSLTTISFVHAVEPSGSPAEVIKELCSTLVEAQTRLMNVNNECVRLQNEVAELKQTVRRLIAGRLAAFQDCNFGKISRGSEATSPRNLLRNKDLGSRNSFRPRPFSMRVTAADQYV